jgi:hypothetical protein
VDTRGNGFATIRDEELNQTLINVPSLAGSGLPFLSPFAGGDPMYSQWFVSTGTNDLLTHRTWLDDPQDGNDSNDSTCIFFLDQPVSIIGDQGTTPPSEVPDVPGPPGPPSGGGIIPTLTNTDGTLNSFGQLFLGFLMVAGMVFIGTRQGAKGGIIAAMVFIGLFLAYSLGWMPLWIILVAFVLALAAVWFLPKPNGSGI